MTTTVATQEFQVEALGIAEEVAALRVVDQPSFDRAGLLLRAIGDYLKRVREVLDPIVRAAHQAHKVAVEQKQKLEAPALSAELALRLGLAAYDERARQRIREAEQQAAIERARLEEEAKLQAALEAEARGDDEGAQQIMDAPTPPTPILVPAVVGPALPKTEGVSFRDQWDFELTDETALPRQYLMPDLKKIGAMVRALKGETNIPGITVKYRRVTVARA